jgi:hypothetical protein
MAEQPTPPWFTFTPNDVSSCATRVVVIGCSNDAPLKQTAGSVG